MALNTLKCNHLMPLLFKGLGLNPYFHPPPNFTAGPIARWSDKRDISSDVQLSVEACGTHQHDSLDWTGRARHKYAPPSGHNMLTDNVIAPTIFVT